MSMIFDNFPNIERARAFQHEVKERFDLDGAVFIDPVAAHEHDPFPWRQIPPVVHIDRADHDGIEKEVEDLVNEFGGAFAVEKGAQHRRKTDA
jgi:hypothetical protein